MNQLIIQRWALSTLFIIVFAGLTCEAADGELSIPRIDGQPTLADFTDMQPSTSLAKSMNKAENFVQREPYPGQPSAQHTEAYIGYDDENLYVVFSTRAARTKLKFCLLSSRRAKKVSSLLSERAQHKENFHFAQFVLLS